MRRKVFGDPKEKSPDAPTSRKFCHDEVVKDSHAETARSSQPKLLEAQLSTPRLLEHDEFSLSLLSNSSDKRESMRKAAALGT